ncbi:MAG: hypothetical protein ACOCVY_02230 [Patescibacteria group bacterium]
MYYRTASIILNTGQKAGTVSDIFIAQPDFHKESLAGKLFILVELESEKSDALKVINFLINNINHNYYQNEKVVLRERIDSLKVEHIFETALAKTNKDLVDFLSNEKIKISPYAFNATVAIIHEDNIHFATVGKNKNLLIYRDKPQTKDTSEQEAEYKITEVSDNRERKTKQTNLTKLFSEVTSGRIPTNAYFLLVNEALSEYLSNKQLIDIVTTLPPQGAASQIKNTLSQVNAVVAFLGVIIKNTTSSESISEDEEYGENEEGDETGLSGLNNTEEETEKILAPSGVINFRDWAKKGFYIISTATRSLGSKINAKNKKSPFNIARKRKLFPLKDKVFFKKRQSQFSLSNLASVAKKIGIFIFKLVKYIFDRITETIKNREKKESIGRSIKKTPQIIISKSKKTITEFGKIQKKYKIILGVAALLLIALIINISLLDKEKEQEQNTERVNELLAEIESNQNKIEANLLYQNEEGAKEMANKNRALMEELEETASPENKEDEKYQEILSKREEFMQELRHAIDLEGAEHILDITDLQENASVSEIMLSNNNIYLADAQQQNIYNVNAPEKTGNIVNNSEITGEPKYPVETEGDIYYLKENGILQFNIENENASDIGLDSSIGTESVSSMASYAQNIYLLHTRNDQIYKYQKQGDSFTNEQEWLQEQADLANAVDLAIDGNVYILNNDGEVRKYLQGGMVELEMDTPEPPFKQTNKIKVSPEMDEGYIYILEPAQNRLVVFDKEGEFLMQYKDSGFADLKDVAIDEENEKIYLLNADSVYRIEAEHLE